ncbi:ATP-binding protein [Magnetospirillum molischianum]|uniref:histidine kinase n=1 Tax=Magnetospirillum molischianum DSM 120 TaxID=1150626 RepID=H8FWF2_MAGML|nr:ATP-binding protein [Magnetospirillum molischianum]CCG42690.1 Putative two-component sensor histidine kinase, classical system [Magnetospirillum molischianum DSM 120]
MKGTGGLSRRIIRSMVSLALGTTVLTVMGSYAFYTLWFFLSPSSFPGPDGGSWFPTPLEWGWMALTALLALALAVSSALGLARRILVPLNSVAESLRQVAQGDLSVRASTDDHSLGEAARLVRDFNAMAERLERMERERQFWNAAIAHELRTPVTVLRGRLQGLTEGVFEPAPALFRSLLTQVEGLGRLIEDLRLVGLAENGRLEVQRELTDLSKEVAAVVQAFEPSLAEGGFSLSCLLETRPVPCDPVRIRQALLALLENALHHATPGPLRIQVRNEHGRCHLLVEDSGPGVPEVLSRQIFEAFQRGEPHGRGSGLGLAVVQAIARVHGGDVTCGPSTLGGTAFDLYWPA